MLGPEVEAFEERFAAFAGTAHCVGVACGLDALHLSLVAMGIGPGDEVLVPATTYIATWLAVTRAGAQVVPVEPDPRTGNIDPRRLEAAITPRARAIIPVHLTAFRRDMDEILAVAVAPWAAGDRGRRPGARRASRRPAGRRPRRTPGPGASTRARTWGRWATAAR